jgi:hypothetical protein
MAKTTLICLIGLVLIIGAISASTERRDMTFDVTLIARAIQERRASLDPSSPLTRAIQEHQVYSQATSSNNGMTVQETTERRDLEKKLIRERRDAEEEPIEFHGKFSVNPWKKLTQRVK